MTERWIAGWQYSLGEQASGVDRLVRDMTPSMNADQLRDSFRDFFAAKDHTRRAVGEPHPARSDGAVQRGRHGAVQAVLRRRRAAAVPPGRSARRSASAPAASTTTSTTSAAPTATWCSSRCSATSASATTSRTTAIPWAGSWSPAILLREAGDSTATGCGSPSTRPTTRPRRSGTRSSACRWTASSASATRTTSGRWATPARAGRAARSTSTAARRSAPKAARSATRPATGSSSSGTSCSCSSTRRPTARGHRCRSRRSTPAPASSASSRCVQGVDSVWETDLMPPLIDEACSITGKSYRVGDYDDRDSFALRVLAEHARIGGDARQRRRLPVERGPRLRAAPHHPARRALRLPARHRTLVMPRLAEVAIDVMGNAYPDVVKNRDFVVERA